MGMGTIMYIKAYFQVKIIKKTNKIFQNVLKVLPSMLNETRDDNAQSFFNMQSLNIKIVTIKTVRRLTVVTKQKQRNRERSFENTLNLQAELGLQLIHVIWYIYL